MARQTSEMFMFLRHRGHRLITRWWRQPGFVCFALLSGQHQFRSFNNRWEMAFTPIGCGPGRTTHQGCISYMDSRVILTKTGITALFLESKTCAEILTASGSDIQNIKEFSRSTQVYSGEGNGNPLQYSYLENPMDRGAWWATVHGVAKSWTRLSDFTSLHFTQVYSSLERLPGCCPVFGFSVDFLSLFIYFH